MCTSAPLDTCPSGHLVPKIQKFPLPTPSRKIKKFYGPSHALPTPFQPFPRLHTLSTRPAGTGLDGLHGGSGCSWLRHNGSGGRDGGSRGLTGRVGRCEGVSRVCGGCDEGGSPCDGSVSVPVSRDSPGGRGEGVTGVERGREGGSPCDGVGSGLGFRDSPSPPLPGSSGGDGGRKM